MSIAYFDCFSGISGDMTLGALIDAGVPLELLRSELLHLDLAGYELDAEEVTSQGIRGTRATVRLIESPGTEHVHRGLHDIQRMLDASSLSEEVVSRSESIFRRLAEAEARAHKTNPEEVHFHEVGAVDSIVDIVGVSIGLKSLGISAVYSSGLPLGRGFVRCEHGLLPVPAPATLELVQLAGAPIVPTEAEGEMVTPTGAAILATLAEFRQPPMKITKVGYGFGQRELAWPNALRIWVGQPAEITRANQPENDAVVLLETNVDDMSPELHGYLMERLFEAGALDVYFTPIYMKKNRPAVMVSVIATAASHETLSEIILSETTTLGLRVSKVGRHKTERESLAVQTSYGPVRVKAKRWNGQIADLAPEYEDCAAVARREGIPLRRVYETVRREASAQLAAQEAQSSESTTQR